MSELQRLEESREEERGTKKLPSLNSAKPKFTSKKGKGKKKTTFADDLPELIQEREDGGRQEPREADTRDDPNLRSDIFYQNRTQTKAGTGQKEL